METAIAKADPERTEKFDLALLLMLGVIIFSSGLGLRDPWPADEPRFALIALEMVEHGDWLFPHRAGELYAHKPPLFMWAIALALLLTGSLRLAFLLPSLIASLITLALVYDLGRRLWHRRVGLAAGLTLLTLIQFPLQAKTAQIDASLTLWTTLGLYGLCRHLLLGPAWRWWYLAWFSMGLGVITKGVGFLPVLALVPWAFAAKRKWAKVNKPNGTALRWLLGPLLMVVAIGLWLVPMLIAVRTGNTPDLVNYRNEVLWGQTIQRYSSFEGHQHHLGYYFFQAIPTLWMPVSLLLPWFIPAWFRRLKRRDARYLFLLGWVVLVVLFFTFSSGKRGVYILPATPALALACAPLVAARIDKLPGVRRISFGVLCFLTLVFLLLGAVWNSNMAMEWTSQISQHGIEPAGFLFSLGVIGLLWAVFCRPQRGLLALAGFLASLWILYGWWGYPILDPARSSSLLMQAVNQSVPADIDLAIVGWKEQMILHAKRPITHWGYLGDRQRNPATEAKVRSMASWLQDGKKRRAALMPRSWLEPCFQAGDHVSFGKWHGFQWVLVDATDTTGNCDEDVEHHDAIFRTMPVHAQQIRPGDFP